MELLKEGEGDAAVLLAHGYGYGMDEWGGFFIVLSRILQDVGFAVYRFNFRQATLSDEISQLEDAVRQVRAHHKKIFLVGMSTGAMVAALEREPVSLKALISPVVDAKKTFNRLAATGHSVSREWMEDASRHSLAGKRLDGCVVFYGTEDKYITLEEFDSISCEKVCLDGWAHGPESPEQMEKISKLVAQRLEKAL